MLPECNCCKEYLIEKISDSTLSFLEFFYVTSFKNRKLLFPHFRQLRYSGYEQCTAWSHYCEKVTKGSNAA